MGGGVEEKLFHPRSRTSSHSSLFLPADLLSLLPFLPFSFSPYRREAPSRKFGNAAKIPRDDTLNRRCHAKNCDRIYCKSCFNFHVHRERERERERDFERDIYTLETKGIKYFLARKVEENSCPEREGEEKEIFHHRGNFSVTR